MASPARWTRVEQANPATCDSTRYNSRRLADNAQSKVPAMIAIKTMLDRTKGWFRRGRVRGTSRLELTSEGFVLVKGDQSEPCMTVNWADVRSIRAYKYDAFCYDIICLAFQVAENSWYPICEDDQGFDAVRREMERRFPDIPSTWFCDIAVPAFAPNHTVLHPFDQEQYSRQVAERKAATRPVKPALLSRWDVICMISGIVAVAILYGSGHRILLVAAAGNLVLTSLAGMAIRRYYDIHDPSRMLIDIVLRCCPSEQGTAIVESMMNKSYARAVPLCVRIPHLCMQLGNFVFLLVAIAVR